MHMLVGSGVGQDDRVHVGGREVVWVPIDVVLLGCMFLDSSSALAGGEVRPFQPI